MLAQNFKAAADLGITEPQLSALQKTLVLLETGKIEHTKSYSYESGGTEFTGHFNMEDWCSTSNCGTVACIGGTAELVGGLQHNELNDATDNNDALDKLFYPRIASWGDITPAQAATALRSYLTTGDARWDLAVAV